MKQSREKFAKRISYFAIFILAMLVVLMGVMAPEMLVAGSAALAIVPIFGSVELDTFKVLTPEQLTELETKDLLIYFNELNAHKAKQMDEYKEQLQKDSDDAIKIKITELRNEMAKDNISQLKALNRSLDEQGLAIKQLMLGKGTKKEDLAEYLEANKATLLGIMRENGTDKALVIKADTIRASVTNNAEAYNIQSLGQLATRKLTFYDLFNKVPVGSGSGGVITYYDWDEATTVKAAAAIAEGAAFPESTAKFKWYSLPLVKVGDTLPVSEEFEKDMPRFAVELALFLKTNVDIVVDDQLYDGPGTGTSMTGAYTKAVTFTATEDSITDASIYDLIVTMRAAMVNGKRSKYEPNFAAMNALDVKAYKLTKDDNSNYVTPPFVTADGKTIDGMVVMETAAVTADTLLLGDSRFGTIYEVEGYTLEKGYRTGDWEKDMPSLKVRRRLNLVIKNADAGAFMKCTSIADDLETLATVPS